MKLFKDCFTNKDIFSDAYKHTLIDDLYYVVEGKMIAEDSSISDALIGGNKSAEGEDDNAGEDSVTVASDIVTSSCLEEVPSIVSKKDYKDAIKVYLKKLVEHVALTDPERATVLKTRLNEVVKVVLGKFKTLRFYATSGDAFELEGIIIPYEQDADLGVVGTVCKIMVFKDALVIEKC